MANYIFRLYLQCQLEASKRDVTRFELYYFMIPTGDPSSNCSLPHHVPLLLIDLFQTCMKIQKESHWVLMD